RGVMALVALAVSFLVLNFFILPAILQGSNPLVVAVVGASAIMLLALYLCHGPSARTSVAVLGTLISLLLIGILGSVFIGWAALTGNTDDNTGLIHGLYPGIDMSGLLLAGVIIGSLGVLDDVTVTQTSAVWELHEANPSMGRRGLYRAGIRIGRDHIASVVNTLVLAYAGAALPLLLLFSIAQSGVGTVANSELVAEEIVRTLIGSIGLVASVPVTTALAAVVVSADRPAERAQGRNRGDGHAQVPEARSAASGGRGRRRKRRRAAGRNALKRSGTGSPGRPRAAAGALLRQDPVQRVVEVGVEVGERPLLAQRHQFVGAVEEGHQRCGRRAEERLFAADLKPDQHLAQHVAVDGGDTYIPLAARPADAVDQQFPAERPGHRGVPGQVEGEPHGVRITGIVPQRHREAEGQRLRHEKAHDDICVYGCAHRLPRHSPRTGRAWTLTPQGILLNVHSRSQGVSFQILIDSVSDPSRRPSSACRWRAAGRSRSAWCAG